MFTKSLHGLEHFDFVAVIRAADVVAHVLGLSVEDLAAEVEELEAA